MQNAIRFSFDDGRLESICASDDEPIWVLNVKRSMLSALQNVWNSGNEMEMEEVRAFRAFFFDLFPV